MRLLFFTLLISKYLGEIRQDHANILFLLQICLLILAFIGWFFSPHDCSVCQKAFQCCFLNRKLHETGHFICLLCLGSKHWDRKESDTTEWLNGTESHLSTPPSLIHQSYFLCTIFYFLILFYLLYDTYCHLAMLNLELFRPFAILKNV